MSDNNTYSKALFGLCLFGLVLAIVLVLTTFVYVRMSDVSDDLFKFAGRLHPVTLHIPIGTISVLFLLEVFSLFMRRRSLVAGKMVVLAFTVTTLAVAACTGLLLEKTGGYEGELLNDHRQQGLILAGLIASAAFFRLVFYASNKGAAMLVYIVLLICSMGVMALAGHSGGSLTHGTTFLTKYQPEWLGGQPVGGVEGPGFDEGGVLKILSEKCAGCHGADKQKSEYRMDTRAEAFTAGDSELAPIVEGKAMDSYLVRLITYDPGDEDAMPPEGKPQLSDDEILQIIHWIDAGAPWAEGTRVVAPKKVESKPGSEPGGIVVDTSAPGGQAKVETKPAPVPRIAYIDTKAFEEQDGGILVTELEPGKLAISLSAGHREDPASFDLPKALAPYRGKVQCLNVAGAGLSPETWTVLAGLEGLVELHAAYTNLGDLELEALGGLSSLARLNLHGTKVSIRGLEKLVVNKNLRYLWVNETELMNADVDKLRAAMPDCDIIFK
jgi:uncharacterized membrane protein/mono/diheme cytochrome c family protein